MKYTIGFIGSGSINSVIARLAVAAGYPVILSNSRGADTLADLVAELGPLARAATPEEAAHEGELIMISVPFGAYEKTPVKPLAGKIVIDTMNYYPGRDGGIPAIDTGMLTTSQLVQQHLQEAKVVKTLHNQDAPHLLINASLINETKRTTLPIAGDDDDAKAKVAEFLTSIGYHSVDVGSLSESWRIEPGSPIYVWPYAPKVPDSLDQEDAIRFYRETPGRPVSEDQVREMVAVAVRKFPIGGFPEDLPPAWVAIQKSK